MDQGITRRDFLNGMSLTAAGLFVGAPAHLSRAGVPMSATQPYYPPALTGMRGSHDGAYDSVHALVWNGQKPTQYEAVDDTYDLVIVGAGISGLAAALFYQQLAGEDKKILLLDNHDDFGGHARRNEFHIGDRLLLGAGGSLNLESFHRYSDESRGLLHALGFDLSELVQRTDASFPLANPLASIGLYTERAHFGSRALIHGSWLAAWQGVGDYKALIKQLPVTAREQNALIELVEGTRNLLKPIPQDAAEFVRRVSYQTFMTDYVGVSASTATIWNPYANIISGVGVESMSISESIRWGAPGAAVLPASVHALFSEEDIPDDGGTVWLPDGNATLVRQMVRRLIPAVAAGTTVADVVTANFDYTQLDASDAPVRLRLNSSVVNVVNNTDNSVSVSYVEHGRALRVKGRHCILACYNGMIPPICPDLPATQKAHLQYGTKVPLIAVNVLLRRGQAFATAGSDMYLCPSSYFKLVTTPAPTKLGGYQPQNDPDKAQVVYLLGVPTPENDGSHTARDLFRIARHHIYTTSFADFEQIICNQLTDMFEDHGFDANRDIAAITVNRWSHGYAYEYMDLFDPHWPEGQAPHELGRVPVGRISIANSDSEAHAYVDAAIDAAWRAVKEQLGTS